MQHIYNIIKMQNICLSPKPLKRDLFGNVVKLKKSQDACPVLAHRRNSQGDYKLLKIEVYEDNRKWFHYSDNNRATVLRTIFFLCMFTVDIWRHRKGSCAAFPLKPVMLIKLISILCFRKWEKTFDLNTVHTS